MTKSMDVPLWLKKFPFNILLITSFPELPCISYKWNEKEFNLLVIISTRPGSTDRRIKCVNEVLKCCKILYISIRSVTSRNNYVDSLKINVDILNWIFYVIHGKVSVPLPNNSLGHMYAFKISFDVNTKKQNYPN